MLRSAMRILDETECLRLLAEHTVGRIGLSVDALPVVLPVNYVAKGDRIYIRTGAGTKLTAAMRNAVVCFEVDEINRFTRSGWSVLATGQARELQGVEAAQAATLDLQPWAAGVGEHLIVIDVELISGRLIPDSALVPS